MTPENLYHSATQPMVNRPVQHWPPLEVQPRALATAGALLRAPQSSPGQSDDLLEHSQSLQLRRLLCPARQFFLDKAQLRFYEHGHLGH